MSKYSWVLFAIELPKLAIAFDSKNVVTLLGMKLASSKNSEAPLKILYIVINSYQEILACKEALTSTIKSINNFSRSSFPEASIWQYFPNHPSLQWHTINSSTKPHSPFPLQYSSTQVGSSIIIASPCSVGSYRVCKKDGYTVL